MGYNSFTARVLPTIAIPQQFQLSGELTCLSKSLFGGVIFGSGAGSWEGNISEDPSWVHGIVQSCWEYLLFVQAET